MQIQHKSEVSAMRLGDNTSVICVVFIQLTAEPAYKESLF